MDLDYWKSLPWVDKELDDECHEDNLWGFLNELENFKIDLPSCKIDLLKNEEFVLKVAETHGSIIEFSIYNKEITIAAAANWRDTLFHISEELCSDKDVIMSLVKNFGFMLREVSEPLKSDKDVLIAALEEVETNRIRYDSLDEAQKARWEMDYEDGASMAEQVVDDETLVDSVLIDGIPADEELVDEMVLKDAIYRSKENEIEIDDNEDIYEIGDVSLNKYLDTTDKGIENYAHNFDGFNRSLTRRMVCKVLDDSGLPLSVVKEAIAILTYFDSDGFCGLDLDSRKWESFFMNNKLKASDMRRIEALADGEAP